MTDRRSILNFQIFPLSSQAVRTSLFKNFGDVYPKQSGVAGDRSSEGAMPHPCRTINELTGFVHDL